MDVRDINRQRRAPCPLPRLDQLIRVVGMPSFTELLFRELRDMANCAHISALLFANGKPVEIVLAMNQGPLALAHQTAQKYVSEYWKYDPVNELIGKTTSKELSARFSPSEINERNYRRDCYSTHNLIDRFSVLRTSKQSTMRINIYRSKSAGRFSDNEIDSIINASWVLFPLVAKHQDLRRNSSPDVMARERLQLAEPALSSRELDICAGIVCGQTSEAIALSLGLSVNTVLTYRKRAYARLGISTQNELMWLLMKS